LPRAIICTRWPIVSQEANANSVIMKGAEVGFLRLRFFIAQSLVECGTRASHQPRSAHYHTPLSPHLPIRMRSRSNLLCGPH
jgi:hypothetical protein